jgi:hypothetical protein
MKEIEKNLKRLKKYLQLMDTGREKFIYLFLKRPNKLETFY